MPRYVPWAIPVLLSQTKRKKPLVYNGLNHTFNVHFDFLEGLSVLIYDRRSHLLPYTFFYAKCEASDETIWMHMLVWALADQQK